jgi:hypothetical protein
VVSFGVPQPAEYSRKTDLKEDHTNRLVSKRDTRCGFYHRFCLPRGDESVVFYHGPQARFVNIGFLIRSGCSGFFRCSSTS